MSRDAALERLTLRVDDVQEVPERDWTLRAAGGRVVATYDVPHRGVPYVRPAAGGTYRVEPYGRGWRLVARATWDDQPLLWYTGRWIRSGGRLLVAPDRAYDVASSPFRRLDLHVAQQRRLILDATARPRRDAGADIDLAVWGVPRHEPDAELLVTFLGALEILVFRAGRSWRALRAPA